MTRWEGTHQEEDETFRIFYNRLLALCNEAIELDVEFRNGEIVRKILCSLNSHMKFKGVVIREVIGENIDTDRVSDLVSNLINYEIDNPLPVKTTSTKHRDLALKTSRVLDLDSEDSSDEKGICLYEKFPCLLGSLRDFYKLESLVNLSRL